MTFFHALRWADDKSGRLPALVAKFTENPENLSRDEVATLHDYLSEWVSEVSAPPEEIRLLLANAYERKGLVALVASLRKAGVSPF